MEAIEVKAASEPGEAWGDFNGLSSLFVLEIGNGTARQTFRFVPSTSSFQTWVPAASSCIFPAERLTLLPSTVPRDPEVCGAQRGVGLFDGVQQVGFANTTIDTYQQLAIVGLSSGSVDAAAVFGSEYEPDVQSGADVVSVQVQTSNNWTSSNTDTPIMMDGTYNYTLPTLGMGFGTWSSDRGGVFPSFMLGMARAGQIPSSSFGYTAGAFYEASGTGSRGSLVLGGYDAARIRPETTATFNISRDTAKLLVSVGSVTVNAAAGAGSSESDNTAFDAVIDSTLPWLYLPDSICDLFVRRFNLTEDTARNYFTIDSESVTTNDASTESISFLLQNALDSGDTTSTTITLPYLAFNASAHWSLGYTGVQPIFPIRRQLSNGNAVLGRAFLQEAYIHANYQQDVLRFNVSQRAFPDDTTPANIVTVHATRLPGTESTGLSRGAIAGIVIGAVAAVAIVVFGILFFLRRRNKKQKEAIAQAEMAETKDAYADFMPGDPRRGTISSTWSAAATEIDGTTSSFPNSPRPAHVRHQSTASELSSDSDHERGHSMMATLHEAPYETGDKNDASTYEELERRMKLAQQPSPGGPSPLETPMAPQELPGSHDWVNPSSRDNVNAASTPVTSPPHATTPGTTTPVPASSQRANVEPTAASTATAPTSTHLAP